MKVSWQCFSECVHAHVNTKKRTSSVCMIRRQLSSFTVVLYHSFLSSGTKGETQAFKLGAWFQDDFRPGQVDEYTVEGEDVGNPIMIRLTQLHLIPSNDWLVNHIQISKMVGNDTEGEYHFPCYRWVRSELVVFSGEGNWTMIELLYKVCQTSAYQQNPCPLAWCKWILVLGNQVFRNLVKGG